MNVHVRRNGKHRCVELQAESLVCELKEDEGDAVWYENEEICAAFEEDVAAQDTRLCADCTVEVVPLRGVAFSHLTLQTTVRDLPYAGLTVAIDDPPCILSASAESILKAVIGRDNDSAVPIPLTRFFLRTISLCALRRSLFLLIPTEIRRFDFDGDLSTMTDLGPVCKLTRPLDRPEMLITSDGSLYCINTRYHKDVYIDRINTETVGATCVESSMVSYGVSRVALACVISKHRVTGLAGVRGKRLAMAYDEGIVFFCLVTGARLNFTPLESVPMAIASHEETNTLVTLHNDTITVFPRVSQALSSGTAATSSIAHHAYPLPQSESALKPYRIKLSATYLCIIDRYDVHVYK
ncbi:hypothetical protein DIPPA_13039 [Diplonema papillatum]|nr:hypothetical protein DIPPA_13039 [Diplonema papillatum]|eukprot:gene16044-24567_t